MGHLIIVIGNVEVFRAQNVKLKNSRIVMVSSQRITIPFFKFRQRQRIFINFQQQLEASINTNTKPFKIQMSDMGSPLAGSLDSD